MSTRPHHRSLVHTNTVSIAVKAACSDGSAATALYWAWPWLIRTPAKCRPSGSQPRVAIRETPVISPWSFAYQGGADGYRTYVTRPAYESSRIRLAQGTHSSRDRMYR